MAQRRMSDEEFKAYFNEKQRNDKLNLSLNINGQLYVSLRDEDYTQARNLLSQGATLNLKQKIRLSVHMIEASYNGHTEVVKSMIEANVPVNGLFIVNHPTGHPRGWKCESGDTALLAAACKGHTEIVKILIEAGAPLNDQNTLSGFTPLHWAVRNGDEELVLSLIKAGADMDIKVKEQHGGYTPLELADAAGYTNIGTILRSEQVRRKTQANKSPSFNKKP